MLTRWTLPSTKWATPSCCPISRRLRCAPVLYCITEVRLITFKSAILARSVKISSCTPSVKKAFSLSLLRFSNGRTAMLFSGMAVGAVTGAVPGVARGIADEALPLATGAERRDNRNPPRASVATIITTKAMIQLRLVLGVLAATGTAAALWRAWTNFCGISGFPWSSV